MLHEDVEVKTVEREFKKPKPSKGVVVSGVNLVVRDAANENAHIKGVLNSGTSITFDPDYKTEKLWLKVKVPINGFVKSEYVSVKE